MTTKIMKKHHQEDDVYEAAKKRIHHLYDLFDEVVVSFSGGKDSTALLLTTIDVARERGRLPVRAVFYDEEAIHPTTIEYVERVRNDPDVSLEWYCLPVKHRNACSNKQPYWHCWHPEEKELWVRPMPEVAITEHERFQWGMTMQDFGIAQFEKSNSVVVQGIRTQESLRRHRIVAMKTEDNYISQAGGKANFAYPIYDWSSEDVWQLVKIKNADYNRTYDIMNRTDKYNRLLQQRVCPPYGEEPIRGLHEYAVCFPEMWDKMIDRVPGAATAARYGNTQLYSSAAETPPAGLSWRKHIDNIILTYDGKGRKILKGNINSAIRAHRKLTDNKIPDDDPHPLSGLSWRFLAKMAIRGDMKGRVMQNTSVEAIKAQKKLGITKEEAEKRYGKRT